MEKEYKDTNYKSDLTDVQWKEIEGFFPSGNKSVHPKRAMVEAVLYIVNTGVNGECCRMIIHQIQQCGVFTEEQNGKAHGIKY